MTLPIVPEFVSTDDMKTKSQSPITEADMIQTVRTLLKGISKNEKLRQRVDEFKRRFKLVVI